MNTYAEILVWIYNNTQSGAITFNNLSFMAPGNYSPGGYPPVINNTVPQGETVAVLNAGSMSEWMYEGDIETQLALPTNIGQAVFNLPGGETLTIAWSLNADTPFNPPTIVASGTIWAITGLTPVVNNSTYTFNLTIAPQS